MTGKKGGFVEEAVSIAGRGMVEGGHPRQHPAVVGWGRRAPKEAPRGGGRPEDPRGVVIDCRSLTMTVPLNPATTVLGYGPGPPTPTPKSIPSSVGCHPGPSGSVAVAR